MIKKNKILILISHFTPGTKMGGPLTSVKNIINNLHDAIDFSIITYDHDLNSSKKYENLELGKWNLLNKYKIFYVSKNIFKFIKVLKKDDHELIYLNSFFHPFFTILVLLLKKITIIKSNLIIAPRGELFPTSLSFKPVKKSLYIFFFKILNLKKDILWHASTEYEKLAIEKKLKIKPNNIFIVTNIINSKQTLIFEDLIEVKEVDFISIIYLSRISKDKNILYTLDVLKQVTNKVKFDVFGPIEDENIWQEFNEMKLSLPNNIELSYHGELAHSEVNKTICKYDLFFLPTHSENFGNAIVESLLSGTQVLISDKTPWNNLAEYNLGWDISLKNKFEFIKVIENYPILNFDEKVEKKYLTRKKFLEKYSISDQSNEFFNLFTNTVKT